MGVLLMLNANTFIEKLSLINVHSFPLPLMGNENQKQHSPTKTNTNTYTTFTINTYQCIHYDCTEMVPQSTSHGLEQNNKTNKNPQTHLQHQNREDRGIKHTNTFPFKQYYIVINEV